MRGKDEKRNKERRRGREEEGERERGRREEEGGGEEMRRGWREKWREETQTHPSKLLNNYSTNMVVYTHTHTHTHTPLLSLPAPLCIHHHPGLTLQSLHSPPPLHLPHNLLLHLQCCLSLFKPAIGHLCLQ